MTEAEWLTGTDTTPMLAFVEEQGSLRKLGLLACAWWRLACGRSAVANAQRIVDVAEQLADGTASHKRLRKLVASWEKRMMLKPDPEEVDVFTGMTEARWLTGLWTGSPPWPERLWWGYSVLSDRRRAALVREVFGNPFNRPVVNSTWLSWGDGTVPRLAQDTYDERQLPSGELDTLRLGILADALEDARCTDSQILDHLRGSVPHVRGCWVVDMLLGKE